MIYQEKLEIENTLNYNDFCCFIYSSDHTYFGNHCHPYYEIIYITKNSELLTLDGRSCLCSQGDLMFVPSLIPHSISPISNEMTEHIILQVSNSFLKSTGTVKFKTISAGPKLNHDIVYKIPDNSQIASIFSAIKNLYAEQARTSVQKGPQSSDNQTASEYWRMKGLIITLFSLLLDEEIITCSSEDDVCSNSEITQIESVLKVMVEHPEAKLSMKDAAVLAGMSYYCFCRTFTRVLGHSFIEHQNKLRVCRAEEFLRDTDKSIAEIAEALNFATLSYFNHTFKKYSGIGPNDYRKNVIAK